MAGVCMVILMGLVGPTLCCPAGGCLAGSMVHGVGTHCALIMYTDIHCCHTMPRCVSHLCVLCCLVFTEGLDFLKGVCGCRRI
jgi:hypothetical protein